jgi:hypothetical protein
VRRGEWAPLDASVAAALTVAGLVLGVVTIILVLAV